MTMAVMERARIQPGWFDEVVPTRDEVEIAECASGSIRVWRGMTTERDSGAEVIKLVGQSYGPVTDTDGTIRVHIGPVLFTFVELNKDEVLELVEALAKAARELY